MLDSRSWGVKHSILVVATSNAIGPMMPQAVRAKSRPWAYDSSAIPLRYLGRALERAVERLDHSKPLRATMLT